MKATTAAFALFLWGVAANADSIAIRNVTVLPMTTDDAVVRNATVVLRDGRIAALGASSAVRIPKDAVIKDGRGKYLMPALADMHVHVENAGLAQRLFGDQPAPPEAVRTADVLLPYVANGVLQIFNLSASSESLLQRAEVESGAVLGPHMALAVMIDGDPPIHQGLATVAATPAAGRKRVAQISAAGYDAVKTYTNLDFETFSAIVEEARKLKLKVLGHLPLRGEARTADLLRPGFGMVTHAEEYAYQPSHVSTDAIAQFVELAKRTETWLITTLKLNERVVQQTKSPEPLAVRPELRYVHPYIRWQWKNNNRYADSRELLPRREQVVLFNSALVRAFSRAGIPMVAGTDALVAGVVPGFGLHDELEALAAAGLSNAEILGSATRRPAEWLGVDADRGTIEAGKRANLLLLDADPRADIANTRKIAAVVAGGRYLPRAELDEMLEKLARRYASLPPPPDPE